MENLYDFFLHYNVYTGFWCAVKRDVSNKYLNGELDANEIIKHKDIKILINYIKDLK